jgi:hypothetical protein
MSEEWGQLALDFATSEASLERQTPLRREQREEIVRLVEYAPFPRVRADQRKRAAFTRDLSLSGMCLGAEAAEPVGSLLRITVRCIDGRPTQDSLARVAWCRPDADGGVWLGVTVLCDAKRGVTFVRHDTPAAVATA